MAFDDATRSEHSDAITAILKHIPLALWERSSPVRSRLNLSKPSAAEAHTKKKRKKKMGEKKEFFGRETR